MAQHPVPFRRSDDVPLRSRAMKGEAVGAENQVLEATDENGEEVAIVRCFVGIM